jgi:hypothetical protein
VGVVRPGTRVQLRSPASHVSSHQLVRSSVRVEEERPFLDGLGSRPALFILYYVKPNPLFQTLSTTAAAKKKIPCKRQISTHRGACIN